MDLNKSLFSTFCMQTCIRIELSHLRHFEPESNSVRITSRMGGDWSLKMGQSIETDEIKTMIERKQCRG